LKIDGLKELIYYDENKKDKIFKGKSSFCFGGEKEVEV